MIKKFFFDVYLKKKDLFIYLFIFIYIYIYLQLTWVFKVTSGPPLVSVSEGGHSSAVVHGLLTVVASLVAGHRLRAQTQ